MTTNNANTIETLVILDDATAAKLQQGFDESGLSKDEQELILSTMEKAANEVVAKIEANPTLTQEQKVGKLTEAYKLIREAAVEKTQAFRSKVRYGAGTGVVYSGKALQKTGRGLQYVGKKIENAGDSVVKYGEVFRDPTKVTDADVAKALGVEPTKA